MNWNEFKKELLKDYKQYGKNLLNDKYINNFINYYEGKEELVVENNDLYHTISNARKELKKYDIKEIRNLKQDLTYLNYDEYNENNFYIKNYIRYKLSLSSKLGFYNPERDGVEFDCDCCSETMNKLTDLLCIIFDLNKEDISIQGSRTFKFNIGNENICFDTDTMSSVATLFGIYFNGISRTSIIEWYNILKEKVDEKYKEVKNLPNDSEKKQLYYQMNDFCLLSYTIGNFVFIPKGYNSIRGRKLKDFTDLTILDLKRRLESNDFNYEDNVNEKVQKIRIDSFNSYINHFKSLYMNRYISGLIFEGKDFLKNKPRRLVNYKISIPADYFEVFSSEVGNSKLIECLENINKMIILRGIDILETLYGKSKEVDIVVEKLENGAKVHEILTKSISEIKQMKI